MLDLIDGNDMKCHFSVMVGTPSTSACKYRLNSTSIPVERYAIPYLSVKQSRTACQFACCSASCGTE